MNETNLSFKKQQQTSETLRRTLNRKFRQTKKAIQNIDNSQQQNMNQQFSQTQKDKFSSLRSSMEMFPQISEQENQQREQQSKTLDKILGAGFKSIDLEFEPESNCDFGDTIPYNEISDKFENKNRREFNDYEILETDEEDVDKFFSDPNIPHNNQQQQMKRNKNTQKQMTEEDYRQELIRQKIKQKYKRGRQPFLSKNFQQRRSNTEQDYLVNPFIYSNQGQKIKPMLLNRSTSDLKKRQRGANSFSPLRNEEEHIAQKYIQKIQQENDNLIKKYSFNQQRYKQIINRQNLDKMNQLDSMMMRNSIYGQTDKSFYQQKSPGMRQTSQEFKQTSRKNRFNGQPDRSHYREKRELSNQQKNSNYNTIHGNRNNQDFYQTQYNTQIGYERWKQEQGNNNKHRQSSNSPIMLRNSYAYGMNGQMNAEKADKYFMRFKEQIDSKIQKSKQKFVEEYCQRDGYKNINFLESNRNPDKCRFPTPQNNRKFGFLNAKS